MSDNKDNRGSADRARIALSEPYEVTYWTKELGVSADELREVVTRVGPMAADVRRALGRKD
ncbi:MAG TPA: DUF3606 domain-containing protein [Polyangiales bacterium]|nr:DUF3606 domain-containing protein [Polyangiales bacterium]